jgi:2-dehydro-3-deoxygluconokinase
MHLLLLDTNMEKTYDIVALGEAMVEFNQLRADEPNYVQGFGGDTSNVVIAASRQGVRCAYLTRVGDDPFGHRLLQLWRDEAVDAAGVVIDAHAPTGIYFVSHGAQGHEFSYLRQGSAASRMAPDNLPLNLIPQARWLHVSGISQAISDNACDTVFAAIAIARGAATRVSFDCNLRLRLWPLARARAIVSGTIELTDLFMPSLDEAKMLTGLDDVSGIFSWCFDHGARAVVLKSGAEGAWYAETGCAPQLAYGMPVQAMDATGAGDCFDGSVLARMARGDTLADAVRYANVCAALSTLGYGAVAPIPRAADVQKRLV